MVWFDRGLSPLSRFILDCLFFPRCISCGIRLPSEGPRAVPGEDPLPSLGGDGDGAGLLCGRCRLSLEKAPGRSDEILPGVPVLAPFIAGPVIVELVRFLKFEGGTSCAGALGACMARTLRRSAGGLPCDGCVLAPVPLHRSRRASRGYNQAELLARAAAGILGAEVNSGLLERTRRTREQSRLRGERRRRNVEGAFALREGASAAGRDVVIVDDLVTTGCTARQCAAAVLAVRPASVRVLAAGMARRLDPYRAHPI